MFGFLKDIGNYSSRKVARDDFAWGFVSTASMSDGEKPYETAVCSREYGKEHDISQVDEMIIVEAYDTREEAEAGHKRWVETMTTNPPDKLVDCCNSEVAQARRAMGETPTEIRIK
jgi:hypothetical protein